MLEEQFLQNAILWKEARLFSAANLQHCLKKGYGATLEKWEHDFLHIDFPSLFLQAFQQSTAASLTGSRSGNPGYIVGKPLLVLSGDIRHAVSFWGIWVAYCSLMNKALVTDLLDFPILWFPHFLNIEDFFCCLVAVSESWDPMDYSLPGSSVHGIFQARILEWVAIFFSRGSFWPRDQTHVSCIGRQILYHWATREAPRTSFTKLLMYYVLKHRCYQRL